MDKNYYISLILQILDSEFKDPVKRKIKSYEDRINFCCPICHDSSTNKQAKRGNLYFNKLLFICFNCGIKTSLSSLCKQFNIQIDPDKKMEMINHLNSVITYTDYQNNLYNTDIKDLLEFNLITEILNSGEVGITDFEPIKEGGYVWTYLLNRSIDIRMCKNIYQAKSWSGSRYENVICFLNRKDDKILGLQIRNIKEGKKRWFKIYNYESLWKWINKDGNIEDIDLNMLVTYNKLSQYFNILNIDFSNKITIFEGYLDSLFYPNSIGLVGVNSDVSLLERSDCEIQYFFDNDLAGNLKSEEKIKNGHKVFLWNKLFEDIVNRKYKEDPYKLLYRISKVKDLNQLSMVIENPFSSLSLEHYYNKDIMDLRYIPKKRKVYK